MKTPPAPRSSWWRRVPVTGWVLAAVAAGHGLFFWLVADGHFMPAVGEYSPPPSPPNFGARKTTTVDQRTGETTTETLFVVSTRLATPTPEVREGGGER